MVIWKFHFTEFGSYTHSESLFLKKRFSWTHYSNRYSFLPLCMSLIFIVFRFSPICAFFYGLAVNSKIFVDFPSVLSWILLRVGLSNTDPTGIRGNSCKWKGATTADSRRMNWSVISEIKLKAPVERKIISQRFLPRLLLRVSNPNFSEFKFLITWHN